MISLRHFFPDFVPRGPPSRGGGVYQLSLPTPFLSIFVCPTVYPESVSFPSFHPSNSLYVSAVFLLVLSFLSSPTICFSFFKFPFATFPFLCGLQQTWHITAVGRSVKLVPKVDQADEEPVLKGCEGGIRHFKGRWCSPVLVDKPSRRRKTLISNP